VFRADWYKQKLNSQFDFIVDIETKFNWNLSISSGDETCGRDGPKDITSPLYVHFMRLLHIKQSETRNGIKHETHIIVSDKDWNTMKPNPSSRSCQFLCWQKNKNKKNAFYGTRTFSTVLTEFHNLTLSWSRKIWPKPSNLIYLRTILLSPRHRLFVPIGICPWSLHMPFSSLKFLTV
jgi:hypothetical protein